MIYINTLWQNLITPVTVLSSIIGVYQIEILNLAAIFGLNLLSTTLGNLKTILLTKRVMKLVYVTTFIDAMVFALALKCLATSSSLLFLLFFAAGRLSGVYLGSLIERKLALGTLEVSIHKHWQEGIKLADQLRTLGYSVTTFKGYGINGNDRLVITVVIPRRELAELKPLLGSRVNMTVKDVSKTYGKIGRVQTNV
jgi:uncharacterized protein YebE (UPF0316 family)